MAYTLVKAQQTVFGDQRVWQGVVTSDAATGVVSFGFKTITHVQATAKSATTTVYNFRINALALGTFSAGDLAISGVGSGSDFYLSVYGR